MEMIENAHADILIIDTLIHTKKCFLVDANIVSVLILKIPCQWNNKQTPLVVENSVNDALEEAARKQYKNAGFNSDDDGLHCYLAGATFGANHQKEKDKDIIVELVEGYEKTISELEYSLKNVSAALEMAYSENHFVCTQKRLIEKAKSHLN